MKTKLSKILVALSGVLFTLLGFSGCDKISEGRVEYGCPHSDFKVDISVTDEGGKALRNIKVVTAADDKFSGGFYEQDYQMMIGKDTLTTDSGGKVSHTYNVTSHPDKVMFYFLDVDGDADGGQFKKDSLTVSLVKTGKGDGNWYDGEFTASAKKTLKKQ